MTYFFFSIYFSLFFVVFRFLLVWAVAGHSVTTNLRCVSVVGCLVPKSRLVDDRVSERALRFLVTDYNMQDNDEQQCAATSSFFCFVTSSRMNGCGSMDIH